MDGLRARAEPRARLLLLPARGASRRVSFPDDAEVDQAVVRSLVSLIELAAATERLFAGRRAEEIAEAESTVAAVRADRGEVEASRKALAAVLAAQEADPRVPPALGALERARKNWFTATGAWPPP
ncbi:hypothetical protein ACFQZC_25605 [Streptacidiphilus monticola]